MFDGRTATLGLTTPTRCHFISRPDDSILTNFVVSSTPSTDLTNYGTLARGDRSGGIMIQNSSALSDPAPEHLLLQVAAHPVPEYEPAEETGRPIHHGQLAFDLMTPPHDSSESSATVIDFPASRVREPAPDPTQWARSIIVATLESLHGIRSPGQLRRWYAPRVHAAVAARAARARPTATPPRIVVRSVRTIMVSEGRIEASGVVEVAGRCRAIALQMTTYDGRWRVTALEIG